MLDGTVPMPSSRNKFVAVCGAAFLLGLALSWSPAGSQFDRWSYDLLLRAQPSAATVSQSVIVAIDEETLEQYGGILGLRTPLAQTLEILANDTEAEEQETI